MTTAEPASHNCPGTSPAQSDPCQRGMSLPRLMSLSLLSGAFRHVGSLLVGWVLAQWHD